MPISLILRKKGSLVILILRTLLRDIPFTNGRKYLLSPLAIYLPWKAHPHTKK